MASQPLAIDIETTGQPWDGFVPEIQEYLLSRARDDEERAAFPGQLALYPGAAKIVAIGMW
ncbi:MAG: 3'-5' exonuclease, partial [Chloroflexota bacterium]|nr:3'-5' exonuclease [Chloroflexota bacterium]